MAGARQPACSPGRGTGSEPAWDRRCQADWRSAGLKSLAVLGDLGNVSLILGGNGLLAPAERPFLRTVRAASAPEKAPPRQGSSAPPPRGDHPVGRAPPSATNPPPSASPKT